MEKSSRQKFVFVICGFAAFFFLWIFPRANAGFAQAHRIIIDGQFSDWQTLSPIYTDSKNDQQSGTIDFGRLWVANDSRYLFLRIEVGAEINLQNNNEITLYLDTDNNSNTGTQINGIGADLQWSFGKRQGLAVVGGSSLTIHHENLGLVTAPTVTSAQFEIALDRTLTFDGNSLFPDDTLRVLFKDAGGDELPNAGVILSYVIRHDSLPPLPVLTIRKSPVADFRVLTYNVLRDGLFEVNRVNSFKRILQAVQPDIIGFEEMYNHSAAQTADQVASLLPLPNGKQWFAEKVDPDVIAVSRFPILSSFVINGNGAFLLDLSAIGKKKMLLIVAHPPCCGKDEQRQQEIDALMAFIRNAEAPGGELTLEKNTPILIIGDMNLVGKAQQLTTLLTGEIVNHSEFGSSFHPDWDGTSLSDLHPRHTNLPMTFTWYDLKSSFSPGRLDYMIYTDSVLQPENHFVLFTPEMSPDSLTVYGLDAGDATNASDHLPVVSDFKILKNAGVQEKESFHPLRWFSLEQNYPNPFNPTTTIRFKLPNRERVWLAVYNSLGEQIRTLTLNTLNGGTHTIVWDGTNDI
ncbi:MAG TPA: hypothetical protein ENH53_12150, partial [Bacteroidetes bacterium]|nr:hypothetical protein [Bacteroidota bacterium]